MRDENANNNGEMYKKMNVAISSIIPYNNMHSWRTLVSKSLPTPEF